MLTLIVPSQALPYLVGLELVQVVTSCCRAIQSCYAERCGGGITFLMADFNIISCRFIGMTLSGPNLNFNFLS